MADMEEAWRPIVGLEAYYSVSSLGRIRRDGGNKGARIGRILKLWTHPRGYVYVRLCVNRAYSGHTIHSLVAAAFIGPRPDGHEVNHINGDKTDNRAANLEYVTPQENKAHSWNVIQHRPRRQRGSEHPRSRLTEADVLEMRRLAAEGVTRAEIGRRYGVYASGVSDIVNRRTWTHI